MAPSGPTALGVQGLALARCQRPSKSPELRGSDMFPEPHLSVLRVKSFMYSVTNSVSYLYSKWHLNVIVLPVNSKYTFNCGI